MTDRSYFSIDQLLTELIMVAKKHKLFLVFSAVIFPKNAKIFVGKKIIESSLCNYSAVLKKIDVIELFEKMQPVHCGNDDFVLEIFKDVPIYFRLVFNVDTARRFIQKQKLAILRGKEPSGKRKSLLFSAA